MNTKLINTVRLTALVSLLAGLSACGGGGSGSYNTPVTVAFASPPPSSLSVSATAKLAAVVTGGSQVGVTWSVSCGAAACGTFNPTSTASGAATTYTPPPNVPNPDAVTITATALADNTQSAAARITLTAPSGPTLTDGTYIFHLSGLDANGPYYVAGAFSVKDGVITGGEQDYTDASVGSSDALVASACSLTVAGSNIQVILSTANPNIGVGGLQTLRGTKVSASRVLISQFDASATATGSIELQTSAAIPTGGYAFGVQGTDTNNGNPLVIGGILSFSGGALSVAGSVFDLNDGPTSGSLILTGQSFAGGNVSAADAYGRVTIELIPSAASSVSEFKFAAYVVGSGRMYLIEDQADALNANLGGVALAQGNNAGRFTLASVSGVSYAHGSTGADAANGAVTLAGGFQLNADGTVSGKLAFVDAGNHNGNVISGTYTVDPRGRVSLNQILLATNAATLDFQLYLDGDGNGIVMGVDSFQTTEGLAFAQAGAGPSGALAILAQGLQLQGGTPWSAVGPVALNAGSFNGFTDYNNGGSPQSAVGLTGSVDSAEGMLELTGLNAADFTVTTSWGYYPIDSNRMLAIEVDGQALGLLWLEAVVP